MKKLTIQNLLTLASLGRNLKRTNRLLERQMVHFWTGQYNYPRAAVSVVWYLSATGIITAGVMLYAFVSILL